MHGPQGTFSARQTSWAQWVRLQSGCTGPKSETTGVSKATAKNRGPLSVVTSNRLRRMHAFVSPIGASKSAKPTTRG